MGNSPTPPGLLERILLEVDRRIAQFARSGFLRNATITQGGLTIKGGFLRMLSALTGGVSTFYVGPITPALPDGSYQPGIIVKRNDGTTVLLLWDPRPDLDGFSQFLGWYDRQGHAIFTDDTDSGLGHARPWLTHTLTAARFTDFRFTTTSATFETVCDALINKQQPKMEVGVRASMDTAGTTGEVRVLVNGEQLGPVNTESFAVSTRYYGPAVVPGGYGEDVLVEVQARRTSATGTLKLEPRFVRGRQS